MADYDYVETARASVRRRRPSSPARLQLLRLGRASGSGGPAVRGLHCRVRIALLSHADTDLLAVRRAQPLLPADVDGLGISLMRLQTEEQLSLLLEGDLGRARVVIVRLHGEIEGVPGFSRLREWALQLGVHLIVVSGTGEPRPDFAAAGGVSLDVVEAARLFLTMGGERNIAECMKYLSDRLLLTGYGSEPPVEVPEHGVYIRDVERATIDDWHQRANPARPTAAVLFYRAHLSSGNLAFVDDLVDALEDAGSNALAVFTSSLRVRENGLPVALQIVGERADVLISTLSFALGDPVGDDGPTVLERIGVPIIQAITSGMAREAWEVSLRGLTALDTAINVAIPEFDGRIVSVPMSFKDRSEGRAGLMRPMRTGRHSGGPGATDGAAPPAAAIGDAGRASSRIRMPGVAGWQRRRPGCAGQSSDAASRHEREGYDRRYSRNQRRADVRPPQSRELRRPAHPLDPGRARLLAPRYAAEFARIPAAPRKRMEDWWGTPSDRGEALRDPARRIDKKMASKSAAGAATLAREPWSDDRDYLFAAMEIGQTLIALQPPRGYGMNPDAIYHTPDLPPTHHYAAFYRWLATPMADGGWGADAIVHVGKHGTLEWLPGKGVGLSNECFPDVLLGDAAATRSSSTIPARGARRSAARAVIVDHLMPAMTTPHLRSAGHAERSRQRLPAEKLIRRSRRSSSNRSGN